MAMKKLLVMVLLLLCVPMVIASSVNVLPSEPNSNNIFYDETAKFTLTISNNDEVDRVYSWSVSPLEWIVESSTAGRVAAGETKQFNLLIKPRPTTFRGPGSYVIPITVETSEDTIQEQLSIFIRAIDERGNYNPSVALGTSLDDEIDPRDLVSTQVLIRNRNNRRIDDLTLQISSPHFFEEDTFSLSGLEERSLQYRLEIDPLVEPGTYEFEAKLLFEGETISAVERIYDIIPYSVIDRDTSTNKKWFSAEQVTQLQNNGNVRKTVSTNLNIPFYKRIFTRIDVEASTIESVTSKSWVIILQPQEKATVYVRENYVAIPIILTIIVILVILYFVLRNPIVLAKQIIVTGKDEEGISEMKVRIYIRNRTDQAFYNLRLLDKAPTIADVQESDGLGVLEPTKIIKTEKKGTIIKWDFDSLEAYEERIVTYTIKSKLKIIGNIKLPKVRVKYETAKGRERTSESGLAQIGTKN